MKNSAVWEVAVVLICWLLCAMYYVEEQAITVKIIVVFAIGAVALVAWIVGFIKSKFED